VIQSPTTKERWVRESAIKLPRKETVVGFLSALESLAFFKDNGKFLVSDDETQDWGSRDGGFRVQRPCHKLRHYGADVKYSRLC
jgi:hypothetical protein